MPINKHQAQALTSLAIACRPHGAHHWDEAGVMAAIAKVRHLALADVALAVIRASDDRTARNPGVISSTSSAHWKERATDRPQPPEILTPAERCSTCSQPRHRCEAVRHADDDHAFAPDFKHTQPAIDTTATIQALKDLKQPTTATEETS